MDAKFFEIEEFINGCKGAHLNTIIKGLLYSKIKSPIFSNLEEMDKLFIECRKKLWKIIISNYIDECNIIPNKEIKELYFIINSNGRSLLTPICSNINYYKNEKTKLVFYDYMPDYIYLNRFLMPITINMFYDAIGLEIYFDGSVKVCIESLINNTEISNIFLLKKYVEENIYKIGLNRIITELEYFYNIKLYKIYEKVDNIEKFYIDR